MTKNGGQTEQRRAHSLGVRRRARWLLPAAALVAVACDDRGADVALAPHASGAPQLDAAAIVTTTSPLSATYRVASDAEKEAALLDIMESFIVRVETKWDAGTGSYGAVNGPGVTQERALGSIAYIYATLLTAKPAQASFAGRTRAELLQRIKWALNEGIATHLVSWGGSRDDDWQGAVPATLFGWAAQLTWNSLSSATRTGVKNMVSFQADVLADVEPQSREDDDDVENGNSLAEENAWNSSVLAVAAAIFDDGQHAYWDHEAKNYAINASARTADHGSGTMIDGQTLGSWVGTRVNLYDDFTLKNHKFFHPTYSQGVFGSLADNAVFYRGVGAGVPAAFRHRLQEVWEQVMAPLSWDDGDFVMPAGTDWVTHDYQHLPFIAYVATRLGRHDASVLESRSIDFLAQRQLRQGGGSLYGHGDIGYETDVVRNAALAWWIHHLFEDSPQPTQAQFDAAHRVWDGRRHFPTHKTIMLRTPNALVSMLWDDSGSNNPDRPAHPTGLVIPSSRNHLADPVLMQYWGRSAVGDAFGAVPVYSCDCPAGKNYFSTAGIIGGTRRFSMTAFSDGTTMLLDRGSGSTFAFAFENDPAVIGPRPVYSDAGPGIGALPGSWANVADRFGLVAKGGTGLVAVEDSDTNPNARMTNPHLRLELTGTTAGNRAGMVLPLATAQQTAMAAQTATQLSVSDTDWSGLIARAPDGTERIAVARWGTPATLAIDVTSSRGAPIFNRQTTVLNNTGTVTWSLPGANNIASTGDTARFYVSSTGSVTVDPLADRLRITKSGTGVATVTVRYVDAEGIVHTASATLLTGTQVVMAHASDQGVVVVYPTANFQTGFPAHLAYDGDTSGTNNFWVSPPSNLATSPQLFQLDFGRDIDIGGLTIVPRVNFGPKDYIVQVLDAATGSWVTNVSVVGAPNTTHVTTLAPVKTRQVQLLISAAHAAGPPTQVQIREVTVVPPALDLDALWPTLRLAAGGWNSAKVRVRNNGATTATVNLAASATAPVAAALSPTSVTVPAGGTADVTVTLSGATATTGASTLTITASGAAPEKVTLLHTDNLALNDAGNNVSGSLPLAFTSSVEAGYVYPPTLANDGNTTGANNFWVSNHESLATSPQHIGIDFGSAITVGRVIMTPRVNYGPKEYTIQTSVNGSSWTSVTAISDAPNATVTTTFTPVSARYLRLLMTAGQNPSPGFVQVRELAVYRN